MTTVHWYKDTKETYNTAVSLLDEAPIRREMDNLKKLVEVRLHLSSGHQRHPHQLLLLLLLLFGGWGLARDCYHACHCPHPRLLSRHCPQPLKPTTHQTQLLTSNPTPRIKPTPPFSPQVSNRYGKPLRVAEMNTISNSGRDGVSNVFAAALWTLDGCFEVAAAGAVGVNLHQGSGQNLYTAIVRWYQNDLLGPVIVRPPFYAFALWKQAVRSNSRMLPAAVAAGRVEGLKVWPLWGEPEREVRVVVINKRASEAVNATLRLDKPGGFGSAVITRLVAQGERPLEGRGGAITLGGISYGMGGVTKGAAVTESVVRVERDGRLAYTVHMPPGSAALVVIKRLW